MNLDSGLGEHNSSKYQDQQYTEESYIPSNKPIYMTIEMKAILIEFLMINNHLKALQKQIDTFNQFSGTNSILFHLRNLKALFNQLQEEDLSQNIEYAFQLSNAWHGVADHFTLMTKSARKGDFYKEGSLLIESISHYPPHDEHSLGYYLFHYAGENWLPFPFMKLIQSLHEEHINDKFGSHLEIWSQSISQLIEIFTRSLLSSPQVG